MAFEEELEAKTILRRTRVEVAPYIAEMRGHRRAVLPRIAISERWIKYYTDLQKVRKLTSREKRALDTHRTTRALYQTRLEMLRASSRYARTKRPTELIKLRLAQAKYYEAKAATLPKEKAEKIREEILPPEDLYDKWRKLSEDIKKHCKQYKQIRERPPPVIRPVERYIRERTLAEMLRSEYAEAAETAEAGKTLPELSREWLGLRGK